MTSQIVSNFEADFRIGIPAVIEYVVLRQSYPIDGGLKEFDEQVNRVIELEEGGAVGAEKTEKIDPRYCIHQSFQQHEVVGKFDYEKCKHFVRVNCYQMDMTMTTCFRLN
eukprot:TRINITY_DN16750_c0_g1_i1.p1 TRINITY_DN16750_c0_g1~~TRINITY_DN16750_c0_g1_i1.p1  ORF type:complete len:110 (+),score=19.64 TRINITY_DN16750_c0_g1_i1:180-509(+)